MKELGTFWVKSKMTATACWRPLPITTQRRRLLCLRALGAALETPLTEALSPRSGALSIRR